MITTKTTAKPTTKTTIKPRTKPSTQKLSTQKPEPEPDFTPTAKDVARYFLALDTETQKAALAEFTCGGEGGVDNPLAVTHADYKFLTVEQARLRYGYKSAGAFWKFVHDHGLPHIRLNARRIMFDPLALAAWEDRRRVGGHRA